VGSGGGEGNSAADIALRYGIVSYDWPAGGSGVLPPLGAKLCHKALVGGSVRVGIFKVSNVGWERERAQHSTVSL